MIKHFTITEKIIMALMPNNHTSYSCAKHGVFTKRHDLIAECPYKCKGEIYKIDNQDKLKAQFKKELSL